MAALFEAAPALLPGAAAFLAESDPRSSRLDGGPLIYVLDTPHGSIYVNGSPGYWTGIVRDLSPDVAIVSLTGRPNIDGEPIQGSLADYLVEHVSLLGARRTVICHHDVLLPGLIPAVDTSEAIARLGRDVSGTALVNLEYDEPVPVLRERPL